MLNVCFNIEDEMEPEKEFKTCSMCGCLWQSREHFLNDPQVVLNGYIADFDNLTDGLLFFTHHIDGCFTTVTIEVGCFLDLYQGARYRELKLGKHDCHGHCLDRDDLQRCDAECEYAYAREILQLLNAVSPGKSVKLR